MNNHIAIQTNGKYMALPTDFSIDIEDVNPYFNDGESFTYEAIVPIDGNRHLLKNVDDHRAEFRAVELEKTPVRILVDGIPFRSGRMRVNDEQDIDGSFAFSTVSSIRTLSELIADMNCTDVPVKDKIQIGEMIGEVVAKFNYTYGVEWRIEGYLPIYEGGPSASIVVTSKPSSNSDFVSHTIPIQALGYSFPAICHENDFKSHTAVQKDGKPDIRESFINVSDPYPEKMYCNARICYKHYAADEDGKTTDNVSSKDYYDPYYPLQANRAQSGICFYVLYFLDCLFHHLGIQYNNAQLLTVDDLRRLCFVTTKCSYDVARTFEWNIYGADFTNVNDINNWLSSRQTRGLLSTDYNKFKDISSLTYTDLSGHKHVYKQGDKALKYNRYVVTSVDQQIEANVMNMYANSGNFPQESVSSLIDSLWASFGIKFLIDYDKGTSKAVLMRNLYRSTAAPIKINGRVLSIIPIVEKVSGFRMKYSAESSGKEQTANIRQKKSGYDTSYDYIDYSKVDSTKSYAEIVQKKSPSDKTCYIDKSTGNAYRIKVSENATETSELKPSLFEVGSYKGIEIGDCSISDDNNVIELNSNFIPVEFNDINIKTAESSIGADEAGTSVADTSNHRQVLAVYVDEDMWHENCKMEINNVASSEYADFYVRQVMTTDESYDTTSTDDGNSPLQHIDWGLAVSVMRGGGADSEVQTYDYDYDGFGNSKWRTTSGEYNMASDSIDVWGNDFDYNGTQEGIGDEERISLKIRAGKEVNGEILCNDDERDEFGHIIRKVRSRGLFDTFMSEHAHFLLHRHKYRITMQCEAAQLADIPNHWDSRFNIGGMVGWINKISTRVSLASGIETVEIEMFTL